MFWDSAFDFFIGHFPKPIIWAEPGSVIALNTPVIIWFQGSWEAQEYHLYKEENGCPWDTQFPLETRNKANFNIQRMTTTMQASISVIIGPLLDVQSTVMPWSW